MKIYQVFFIAILSCLPGLNQVQADASFAETIHVKAKLIASVNGIHAGEEIYVGVEQRIIPHWHTYWINPGDSGLATTIDYSLPKGSSVSNILWPVPERLTLGPVTNYGYSDQVILLSKLKVPNDLSVGSHFPINAKVKWLVCREECIPEEVNLSLDLPVLSPDVNGGEGSPLIQTALKSLPLTSPYATELTKSADTLVLHIKGLAEGSKVVQQIQFFPEQWGRVVHSADQRHSVVGDNIELQLKSGEDPLKPGEKLEGLIVVSEQAGKDQVTRAYQINTPLLVGSEAGKTPDSKAEPDIVLASALLLALLGGLILNLMPCVFPVLSIKALSLIKQSKLHPGETRLHGWAYTLGIELSFLLLGVILIALKSGGAQIGWGFQFQSPLFVLLTACLMFTVGLGLSGVFTVGTSVMGVGSELANRSGYWGSLFTGVLATVVATPCTAPFMGAALGFALTQPPLVLLLIFQSLGLGLALPYLVISHWPAAQRLLPKPGIWMEHVKQVMAFPMYAAAVWLVWVLAQQAGINAVAVALSIMVAIAFSLWLYESTRLSSNRVQHIGGGIAAVFIIVAIGFGSVAVNTLSVTEAVATHNTPGNHYEPYSTERLKELRSAGKPVFVNFTAAWCISCLVNEKVALSQQAVVDAFKDSGITYLKGDWTNRDAEITRVLAEFGRSGVPLYLYYPPGEAKRPLVLPQILTPEIVTQTVSAASNPVSIVKQ
jgi:thiol:disulfide interchange protein DsbD